ncbi:MAG: glycosyltransferase, partial [Acidimicrobiales bacterium]|nr:glycosyltransferase [Acidimicrobiales bacterium]
MSGRRALFAQQYPAGGSVASLIELLARLPAHGVEAIVALPTDWPVRDELEATGARVVAFEPDRAVGPAQRDGPRRADGAPVDRSSSLRRDLRRMVSRDLPQARWLAEVMRAERVDLLHANNDVVSNRAALLAARRARVPAVVHIRGMHVYEGGLPLLVDRRLAAGVRQHLAISGAVADLAVEQLHLDRDRVTIVDNPFDLSDAALEPSPALARELGVEGRRVIAMVGRIAAWKGHRVLLDAVHQLDRPDVAVLVVGEPASTYGPVVLEQLHERVRELGLEERVLFTGPRRDVPDIMALADVAVHCSVEPEPFGRVIVEAMAAGVPVVASAAGGALEIVEDQRTGLLVAPGDAGALAGAIADVLDHPARAAALGAAARSEVLARFDVDAHVEAVV